MRSAALLREHLAIVLSLASALFVAVRLSAVAGYSRETGYAVLQAQSTTTVVFGALLSALPLIPLGFATMYVWTARDEPVARIGKRLNIVLAGSVLLSSLFMPWPIFVAICATLVLSSAAVWMSVRLGSRREWRRLSRLRHDALAAHGRDAEIALVEDAMESAERQLADLEQRRVPRPYVYCMLALLFAAAGQTALSGSPWLPAERIDAAGETTVGYVLSVDEGQLVVLTDSPRMVVRLPSAGTQREFCRPRPRFSVGWMNRVVQSPPLLGAFMEPGSYTRCPVDA